MAMNRLPLDVPGLEDQFDRIEVRRSPRRRKTVSAEIVGDVLVVSVPERISRAEEQQWVERMADRMSQRRKRDRLNSDGDLGRRAAYLADVYLDGIRPRSIAWATAQRSRWGSCSPEDGDIRLSLELADCRTLALELVHARPQAFDRDRYRSVGLRGPRIGDVEDGRALWGSLDHLGRCRSAVSLRPF